MGGEATVARRALRYGGSRAALSRAEDFSDFQVRKNAAPTAADPLGVKGVGEAGALPAAMNAVAEALSSMGADAPDMSATPLRIWMAVLEARGAKEA